MQMGKCHMPLHQHSHLFVMACHIMTASLQHRVLLKTGLVHADLDAVLTLCCCRDAILHVCRIHRVLMQPRGNALLVGVGGSGRKSLSRLATYVAEQKCFSIEISKGYRITEFREDLKSLYRQVTVWNLLQNIYQPMQSTTRLPSLLLSCACHICQDHLCLWLAGWMSEQANRLSL